jgi:hypothetical protein
MRLKGGQGGLLARLILPSFPFSPSLTTQAKLNSFESFALRHCQGEARLHLCSEVQEDVHAIRAKLSKLAASGVSPGLSPLYSPLLHLCLTPISFLAPSFHNPLPGEHH